MCGIVGYIGPKNASAILLEGLRKLEYRGYDSRAWRCSTTTPSICAEAPGSFPILKGFFRNSRCREPSGSATPAGATHGRPSEENAPPAYVLQK